MSVFTVQSGTISLTAQNTGTAGTTGAPWTMGATLNDLNLSRLALTDNSGNDIVLITPPPPPMAAAGFASGAWFTFTILNSSGSDWTGFQLSLQRTPGIISPDGDGLSFAQTDPPTAVITSDKFASVVKEDVDDNLLFSNGTVANGTSVTFHFPVTDNNAGDPSSNPIYFQMTPTTSVTPDCLPTGRMARGLGPR